jgi:ssDNA-binding replication factor A large subunit
MSRTPARHTQPDIARAIRATKQAGGGVVELVPDGTIRISVNSTTDKSETLLEPEEEVVL